MTDAIALTLALALFVSTGVALSERLIGLRNRLLLVFFAVVWLTSAARRLSEYRQGRHSPLKPYPKAEQAVPAFIVGIGSWYVFFLLYKLHPHSLIWTPAGLPLWLNVIGIVLAVFAVIHQPVVATARETDTTTALIPRLTVHGLLLILGMLLISGSLVIALMVSLWLVMLRDLPANPFAGRNDRAFAVGRRRWLDLGERILSPLKS